MPWSAPIVVGGTGLVFYVLAARGTNGTAHLIYMNGTNADYRKSTDHGATWSTAVTIATGVTEITTTVSFYIDGDNLHFVYVKSGSLYYRKSVDDGANWGSEILLDTGAGGSWFYRAVVRANGSTVVVAWAQHLNTGTYYVTSGIRVRRSTDTGATFAAAFDPLDDSSGNPGRPSMAIVGSTVHMTWEDDRDHGANPGYNPVVFNKFQYATEIYYLKSTDGGATWGPDTRMTFGGNAIKLRPDIVALSTDVTIAYQDDGGINGNEEQYVLHSVDDGANWVGKRLTYSLGESEHAHMDADGSTVLLGWTDYRDEVGVFYARWSYDKGVTWSNEEMVTSYPPYWYSAPRVALTSQYGLMMDSDQLSGGTLNVMRRLITEAANGAYAAGSAIQGVEYDEHPKLNRRTLSDSAIR